MERVLRAQGYLLCQDNCCPLAYRAAGLSIIFVEHEQCSLYLQDWCLRTGYMAGHIARMSSLSAPICQAAPGCVIAYLMLLGPLAALGREYVDPNVPAVRDSQSLPKFCKPNAPPLWKSLTHCVGGHATPQASIMQMLNMRWLCRRRLLWAGLLVPSTVPHITTQVQLRRSSSCLLFQLLQEVRSQLAHLKCFEGKV